MTKICLLVLRVRRLSIFLAHKLPVVPLNLGLINGILEWDLSGLAHLVGRLRDFLGQRGLHVYLDLLGHFMSLL